jgi:hypothetical protein
LTNPSRIAWFVFAELALLGSSVAHARPTRPRFEPTDLDLEEPGTCEFDVQIGPTSGEGPAGNRLLLPDFELDVGLLDNFEIDLDGAFAFERFDRRTRQFTGEPLWAAAKLGLFDSRTDGPPAKRRGLAVGLQLGPRIPTLGARGIGYGALGLVGFVDGPLRLDFNLGGFIDPGVRITGPRPESLVVGLDAELDLDAHGVWSLIGELAAADYLSPDPDEVTVSFGAAVNATPNLEVSALTLAGLLPGADRFAFLIGFSETFGL